MKCLFSSCLVMLYFILHWTPAVLIMQMCRKKVQPNSQEPTKVIKNNLFPCLSLNFQCSYIQLYIAPSLFMPSQPPSFSQYERGNGCLTTNSKTFAKPNKAPLHVTEDICRPTIDAFITSKMTCYTKLMKRLAMCLPLRIWHKEKPGAQSTFRDVTYSYNLDMTQLALQNS